MTNEERLQKEVADLQAQVYQLKRRNDLLAQQFSFYIQYGQRVDDENDLLAQTLTRTT